VRTVAKIVVGTLTALALAACSRGEPQAVIPKPVAPVAMRAETIRIPEAPKPAPRAPTPAPRPAQATPKAPKPPAAAAATPMMDGSSRESLALVPSPGFVEPPRTVAAKVETPKAEPPVQVAAAAPPRPSVAARVMSRVEPDFPRAAFQARVDRGQVKARMTLDGSGNVTRVDIVEAHPRRVFDTAVASALAQWKFNDGAAGRTYDTEVVFQR
jgi:protein TonB